MFIKNIELSVLYILLNRDNYIKYESEIDKEYLKTNHIEINYLYFCLYDLHSRYEKDLTVDELEAYFWSKYPESDKNIYGNLFKTLQELKIDSSLGGDILLAQKKRREALKLSELAFRAGQGLIGEDELTDFIAAKFSGDETSTDYLGLKEIDLDLEKLIEHAYSEAGSRWPLDCLNKSLGSLRAGDFGFIFARPETGKTTILVDGARCFVGQSKRVCWFNNEEQGEKVGLRFLQSWFGITLDQLLSNVKKYKELFLKQCDGRYHLFDSATIHRKDVEKIVKRLEPDIVIYDQIDKIKGFVNDREDLRLGSIYQWARELAKGSHAAIGVCQADGTAEGIRYLTMEHVANAKTAKQAEADWILGIGKSHADGEEYVRYLSISKNKLLGDNDSIPDLRHGRFEVMIRPEIARYEDILKFD